MARRGQTEPRVSSEASRDSRAVAVATLLVVLSAAVLRALPIGNDFWLDEIWSYRRAMALDSVWGVFAAHHSNNHHLSSALMYLVGPVDPWWVHRLPSLAAGVASVMLAAAIGWRRSPRQGVITAFLVGACYAQIHFSSEARGYAPAVALCLLAWSCLERGQEAGRSAAWRWLHGAASLLAVLFHLTALFYLAGAVSYRVLALASQPRRDIRSWGRRSLELFSLPVAGVALLYWVDLRHLFVDSGVPTDWQLLMAELGAYALGAPFWPSAGWLWAALLVATFALALLPMARERDPRWLFFLVVGAIAPALTFASFRPDVVALRYFLVGIAFALVAAGDGLARLWDRGASGRRATALLLALFFAGHAAHYVAFLRHGRGAYREAIATMAREQPGEALHVASDHDFRNGAVLRFYAPTLPADTSLIYHAEGRWPRQGVDWVVTHEALRREAPPQRILDRHGVVYERTNGFEKAGISGFHWDLYRRIERSETAPAP